MHVQIPYTMAKFFFFEYIVGLFYRHVFTAPKESYGKPTQLGVTFASGYIAGVVCAVVSHPADSLVSLMGKPASQGKSVAQIARDALPADASEQDKDSAEIDTFTCDLTQRDAIRNVFAKYGKGGIWGVVHIAVRLFPPLLGAGSCREHGGAHASTLGCRRTRPWASRRRSR